MQIKLLPAGQFGRASAEAVGLTLSCAISYRLMTALLAHARFVSRDDNLLGGMWAVISAVFVFHDSYGQSIKAALSRLGATVVSCALCFSYFLIFPFCTWGLAVMIGLGTLILTIIGRTDMIVTTGITTAVIMVVSALSPHNAWQQPMLRFMDTAVGAAIAASVAWLIDANWRPANQKADTSDNRTRLRKTIEQESARANSKEDDVTAQLNRNNSR